MLANYSKHAGTQRVSKQTKAGFFSLVGARLRALNIWVKTDKLEHFWQIFVLRWLNLGALFSWVFSLVHQIILFCTTGRKKYVKLNLESIIPFSVLYLN